MSYFYAYVLKKKKTKNKICVSWDYFFDGSMIEEKWIKEARNGKITTVLIMICINYI